MRRGALAALALCAPLLWAGPAGARAPGPVLVVGDSLELGTGPHLRRELDGAGVTVDARAGRRSSEAVSVTRKRLRPSHRVLVFDVGANDDPSRPRRLSAALAAALELAGERCMVVATLVRPGARATNAVLERFAASTPSVRLADWRAAVRASPRLIGDDGVHATRAGYVARARLVADAVRACPREEEDGPGPASGRDRLAQGGPVRSRSPAILPALLGRVSLSAPLGVLTRAAGILEDAVAQAEGAIVRRAPDTVLGGEGDPLGRRSP